MLWVGVMNVFYLSFLEVILNCFLNELFKGKPSWCFLLALYGPSPIVCPLEYCVKDTCRLSCGQLKIFVLYEFETMEIIF